VSPHRDAGWHDASRITEALQHLQTANVAQFVTDNAKADLTTFGLQPADLSLWLYRGTNFISALQTGSAPTNDVAQVYTKRERWSVVATVAREPLALWHGAVNDFRDPFLLELTVPVTEIEVHGRDGFTLKQQGTNGWSLAGEKFPADTESVQNFLKALAGVRVSDFVKAAVTAPDLPDYGLDAPQCGITLRPAAGDSNASITQLDFAVKTNGVFVHRADEDFIYAITPEAAGILFGEGSLFKAGWQFRDRHIWNFSEAGIAQVTLRQNGLTRTMVHEGVNQWSPAPGSQGWQGIVKNPPAIEETMHRFGELTAAGWVARNAAEPEKFGLDPSNLEISVELKSGEKFSVVFGTELPSAHTALAAVTLDGERWVFVFPPVLYQFVLSYLTIPANVR